MNSNMRSDSLHYFIKLASELSQGSEIDHKGRCAESIHQTGYGVLGMRLEKEKWYVVRREFRLDALEAAQEEVHVPGTCGEEKGRREEREDHGEWGGQRGGEAGRVE